jgi:hypothetical protein
LDAEEVFEETVDEIVEETVRDGILGDEDSKRGEFEVLLLTKTEGVFVLLVVSIFLKTLEAFPRRVWAVWGRLLA